MTHLHQITLDSNILEITNINYSYDYTVKLSSLAKSINTEAQRKKHDNHLIIMLLFTAIQIRDTLRLRAITTWI